MSDISQRLIMLKPMQNGVSGYARLESRGGQTQLQINARGLRTAALRAFWYSGGGELRELGTARVNPRGEAAITAEAPRSVFAPERLQALLLVSDGDEPSPQMIGLCVQQSAGSLMDAKNAILALCEKLSRGAREQKHALCEAEKKAEAARQAGHLHEREHAVLSPQGDEGARVGAAEMGRRGRTDGNAEAADMSALNPTRERGGRGREQGAMPHLPREVFLPALDPLPYVQASEPALPTVGARAGVMAHVNGAGVGTGVGAMPLVNGADAGVDAGIMSPVNGTGAGVGVGAMPLVNGTVVGAMPPVNGAGVGTGVGAMPFANGADVGTGAGTMPPVNCAYAGAMSPVNGAGAGVGATPPVNSAAASAVVGAMPPVNAEGTPIAAIPASYGCHLPPKRSAAPACDRLRPLLWPKAFSSLKTYFDRCMPCTPFVLPGWRFVQAAVGYGGGEGGLWIGYAQMDGRVNRVAYALRTDFAPKDGKPYRAHLGTDGLVYQVLWQRCEKPAK